MEKNEKCTIVKIELKIEQKNENYKKIYICRKLENLYMGVRRTFLA